MARGLLSSLLTWLLYLKKTVEESVCANVYVQPEVKDVTFRTWSCLISQHVWLFVCSINLTQGGSDGSVVHMRTLEAQRITVCFNSSALSPSLFCYKKTKIRWSSPCTFHHQAVSESVSVRGIFTHCVMLASFILCNFILLLRYIWAVNIVLITPLHLPDSFSYYLADSDEQYKK